MPIELGGAGARFVRATMMAVCLTAGLSAQQLPLALDPEWADAGKELQFQVSANSPYYSLDIEDCPDLSAQCVVLHANSASVTLTYTLDAVALRGQRVRFAASLLTESPAISRAQLFMRVDRIAGVGFHEYTPTPGDDMRDWMARELVGAVAGDAKRVTVGLRFSGRGTVYFAEPKVEKALD